MPEKDFVKARVVDITRPNCPIPSQMAVDANVLYFIYYPNFSDLRLAGGKTPHSYQLQTYPQWFNKALQAKTMFFAPEVTFGEFVRLAEYAEIEAIWVTDPNRAAMESFSPRSPRFLHTRQ